MSDSRLPPIRLNRTDVLYCAVLAIVALLIFLVAKTQAIPMWKDVVTFDGYYYLDIAQHGYAFNGDIESKQNISFLPLEAAALAVVDGLLPGHNSFLKIALFGVAVMFGTLLGFFVLMQDYADKQAARITALIWACGPLALYNFVGYTEPLFALATIWCLVALHRGWMWTASLIAGAALLGRPHAVVLMALVGVELLRQAQWRPWRMLDGTAVFKIAVMAVPMMAFASWQALRFGDSLAYVNSLEAWRRGSFIDGNVSFFRAIGYFFDALTTAPPQLAYWVVMLGSVSLMLVSVTLAFSMVLPLRVRALYLGLLLFLAISASFDAINVARHVFFMVPWAIALGMAVALMKGSWRNKYIALVPFVLICTVINVAAIARYYRGEWVS